jgi:hypothetical protein
MQLTIHLYLEQQLTESEAISLSLPVCLHDADRNNFTLYLHLTAKIKTQNLTLVEHHKCICFIWISTTKAKPESAMEWKFFSLSLKWNLKVQNWQIKSVYLPKWQVCTQEAVIGKNKIRHHKRQGQKSYGTST